MQHTLIIAEAGVNHNGSVELAKRLIDVAADAGVDYVKFQTFNAENLVSKTAKMADYQQRNMHDNNSSQYAMLKKLELSKEQHEELIAYCQQKDLKFFSTAFDMESLDYLASLKLGLWKIPSRHHRYRRIHSKLPRPPPVTGAAYIGTLQNRTCFKGETGWLRNIICPSLRGADFFMSKMP